MATLTELREGFKRRCVERVHYRGHASWFLSVYDHLARRVGFPFPGRGSVGRLKLRGLGEPLLFRLGSTDLAVIEEIFFRGEYNCVLTGKIRLPRVIVDLGANAGYSVRFWKQHYPGCRVVAVEPDRENARLCRLNAEAAGWTRDVELLEVCAGGRHREAVLLRQDGEWSYRMADTPAPGASPVRVLTVPEILDTSGVAGPIDLLKCDIEGAEREVFGAAAGWLRKVRNLVIELHPGYELSQLLDDLGRAGANLEVVSAHKNNTLVLLTQRN